MQLIMAIATLCSLGGSKYLQDMEFLQLKCQKYYIKCTKADSYGERHKNLTLAKCILERK